MNTISVPLLDNLIEKAQLDPDSPQAFEGWFDKWEWLFGHPYPFQTMDHSIHKSVFNRFPIESCCLYSLRLVPEAILFMHIKDKSNR